MLGNRKSIGQNSNVGDPDRGPPSFRPRLKEHTASSPEDLSELWYKLMVIPWTCLAVVSPERCDDAWRLVQRLAEEASRNHYNRLEAINGLNLDLDLAASIAHSVFPGNLDEAGRPVRFLIALDSPLENAISIGILAPVDAVLLVLHKGRSSIPAAQRVVEVVGRERLIGAVLSTD